MAFETPEDATAQTPDTHSTFVEETPQIPTLHQSRLDEVCNRINAAVLVNTDLLRDGIEADQDTLNSSLEFFIKTNRHILLNLVSTPNPYEDNSIHDICLQFHFTLFEAGISIEALYHEVVRIINMVRIEAGKEFLNTPESGIPFFYAGDDEAGYLPVMGYVHINHTPRPQEQLDFHDLSVRALERANRVFREHPILSLLRKVRPETTTKNVYRHPDLTDQQKADIVEVEVTAYTDHNITPEGDTFFEALTRNVPSGNHGEVTHITMEFEEKVIAFLSVFMADGFLFPQVGDAVLAAASNGEIPDPSDLPVMIMSKLARHAKIKYKKIYGKDPWMRAFMMSLFIETALDGPFFFVERAQAATTSLIENDLIPIFERAGVPLTNLYAEQDPILSSEKEAAEGKRPKLFGILFPQLNEEQAVEIINQLIASSMGNPGKYASKVGLKMGTES